MPASSGYSTDNKLHNERSGSFGAKDHKDGSFLVTSTRESRGKINYSKHFNKNHNRKIPAIRCNE